MRNGGAPWERYGLTIPCAIHAGMPPALSGALLDPRLALSEPDALLRQNLAYRRGPMGVRKDRTARFAGRNSEAHVHRALR